MVTNNIEKLYELAGIEKRFKAYTEDGSVKYFHTLDEIINSKIYYRPDMYCCDLDDDAKELPPFTDTKQLELIKLLSKHKEFRLNIDFEEMKITEVEIWTIWTVSVEWYAENKFFKCLKTDFSQALAGLVCELWEDLTEQQKEEVRGILQ